MNKVFLIGNLTRDAELTQTQNGVSVCKFSIAVTRNYGEKETDFFNIVVWRGLAENCSKYLSKGKKVCVIGSLQNRTYEDKNGVKRSATDVIANDIEFLTPADKSSNKNNHRQRSEEDDDLPF